MYMKEKKSYVLKIIHLSYPIYEKLVEIRKERGITLTKLMREIIFKFLEKRGIKVEDLEKENKLE